MTDHNEAYALCARLKFKGGCSCRDAGRAPCSVIVEMVEEGTTADDELQRIADEREAAAEEDW